MLITLLACVVMTFLCWSWGHAFLELLHPEKQKNLPHFSLVCFCGFALVTALASLLSVFTKINSTIFLLFFTLAVLYGFFRGAGKTIQQNFLQAFGMPMPFLLLLLVSSILVMVMSVWHIDHPDTVEYHSAIVNSIKSHGIIKGYANENIRYGLQSSWFIACALAGFNFISFASLTFVNTAVLFWFLLFLTGKIAEQNRQHHYLPALILVLFLSIAFLDFNQIRLTSISASPDFIATIYILLSFYLFTKKMTIEEDYFLILLFCATAISIKLSSFSLALLILFILAFSKSLKQFGAAVSMLVIVLLPILIRNYLTSGYFFFPASILHFLSPAWQVPRKSVQIVEQYIRAYARTTSSTEPDAIKNVLALPLDKWLPIWWSLRNFGQKIILVGSFTALLVGIFNFNRICHSFSNRQKISLAIVVAGLISWFLLAPDPRFGLPWLLLLSALLLPTEIKWKGFAWINQTVVLSTTYTLSFSLAAYLVYRFLHFFDAVNVLLPYGLK